MKTDIDEGRLYGYLRGRIDVRGEDPAEAIEAAVEQGARRLRAETFVDTYWPEHREGQGGNA